MTLPSPTQSVPTPEPTSAAKSASDKAKAEVAAAAPPPTFDALPLSHDVRTTLAEMGYVHPTPVQLAVFEPAKRGKDLVVQARTGTGKTAAFGLPIVDHIVKRSVDRVQVLVLAPTRELALQVAAEVERLGKRRGVRVTAIYGGAPMQKQIDAIAAGAQVICGTPGRVLDHLRRGTLDPRGVKLVVLDESDEMLSMGFERELNAILEHLPADRQTLLFSATLPPDIERIARNRLRSPEFVTLSGDHVGALSIHHYVYMVSTDKTTAFLRMIEVDNPESAIVFCNTRDETERLAGALQRQGFEADWLNGDLDQGEREKVMSATREGRLRFLVATDVAARGIDISHLTHVINFDFPQDAESYVHRTGRTGRAGRTGTAISLVTPHDIGQLYLLRLTYKIRPIEKQVPSDTELKTRAETDLVAMFAEAYAKKPVDQDDLSLARRLLTHDSAEVIVAGLLRDHLGARPTAREEASAGRRAAKPRPPEAPAREPAVSAKAAAAAAAASPVSAAPVSAPPVPSAAPVTAAAAPAALAAAAAAAAPVKYWSPEKTPAEKTPVERAPVEKAPVEKAFGEKAPVEKAAPVESESRPSSPTDTAEIPTLVRPIAAPPVTVPVVAAPAAPAQASAPTHVSVASAPPAQASAPAHVSVASAPSAQPSAPAHVSAPSAPAHMSAPAAEEAAPAAVSAPEAAPAAAEESAEHAGTEEPLPTSEAGAQGAAGAASPEAPAEGMRDARPAEGRYGRRDDRRADRGRRGRDSRAPRGDFGGPGREHTPGERPLDRAVPAQGGPRPRGEGAPRAFVRHADFTTWQPPEEEGDDEPIWGGEPRHGAPRGASAHGHQPHSAAPHPSGHAAPFEEDAATAESAPEAPPLGETVELHVTVGRRDGARASDLVRVLERAGLSKDSVQRVRVRERHAFLTVRKDDEERALAALNGSTVAGRQVTAERARERPAPADARPADPNGGEGEPTE